MRNSAEIVVDECSYSITMYSATKGKKLYFKLLKAFGEPVSTLAATLFNSASDGDMFGKELDPLAIGKAIGGLSEKLNEDEYDRLTKEILETVYVGAQPLTKIYDVHMAGRYMHELKLIGEVLKFQYEDFFSAFADVKERASALKVVSAKSIRAQSIGQSGE